jgi:hypothetical protein
MVEKSTKVELKGKMKNAKTNILLGINRKISCQSFICFDGESLLKSIKVFQKLSNQEKLLLILKMLIK